MKILQMLFYLLLTQVAFSQNSSLEYYPLEIGTYYFYERTSCVLPENDCNTRIIGESVISDTTMSNGKAYFKIARIDYLSNQRSYVFDRIDSSKSVVYRYFRELEGENKERPIHYLAANTGDTNYVFDSRYGEFEYPSTVVRSYNDPIFGLSFSAKEHLINTGTFYQQSVLTESIGRTYMEEYADFYSIKDTLVAFYRNGVLYGDSAIVNQVSNSEFYPLAVGNKWTYLKRIYSATPLPEYKTSIKEVIGEKVLPNGIKYFEIRDGNLTYYERFDTLSNEIRRYEYSHLFAECEGNDIPIFSLVYDTTSTVSYLVCDNIDQKISYEPNHPKNNEPTIKVIWDNSIFETHFQKDIGIFIHSYNHHTFNYSILTEAIINGDTARFDFSNDKVKSESDFYPLAIGNVWFYEERIWSYPEGLKTNHFRKEVIGDSLMPNGFNYFAVKIKDEVRYERYDSLMNEIKYYESSNYSGYDVSLYKLNYSTTSSITWQDYLGRRYRIGSNHFNETSDTSRIYCKVVGNSSATEYLSFKEYVGLDLTSYNTISTSAMVSLVGYIIDGKEVGVITSAKKDDIQSPSNFHLAQNYPNPFNPTTKISFTIPTSEFQPLNSEVVSLRVYDILGRHVVTLVNKQLPAGTHEVEFDASSLASGMYYYRLTTGNYSETKKMVLLR